MEENKKIENKAKEGFDKFEMDPPEMAWDRIESELDRDQAVLYKRKAKRFRNISIALLLLLLSMVGYNYLKTPSDNELASINNSQVATPATETITNNNESASENNNNLNSTDAVIDDMQEDSETGPNPDKSSTAPQNSTFEPALITESYNTNVTPDKSSGNQNSGSSENQLLTFVLIPPVYNTAITIPEPVAEPGTRSFTELPVDDVITRQTSKFEYSLYFSPDYTWQSMTDNTNDGFDDVSMYKDREEMMFSYHAGIEGGYILNDKFTVISGISYYRYSKTMVSPTLSTAGTSKDDMHFEYYTSNGIIELPMDESHAYMNPGEEINVTANCDHSLNYLEIPLLIKYKISSAQKTSMYVKGGIYYSLLLKSKADITYENYSPVVVNEPRGLQNSAFGFNIGAGIDYSLNNRISIFAEPVFRGTLTSVTRNTAVKSYPYSAGLKAGLTLNF